MVPMCTFPFFFFELVPLFVGDVIFIVGKVQTDFLSDKGGDFVSCVFRAVDVTLSGFGAPSLGMDFTGVGGFKATLSGMGFAGVGGFGAVPFFERFIWRPGTIWEGVRDSGVPGTGLSFCGCWSCLGRANEISAKSSIVKAVLTVPDVEGTLEASSCLLSSATVVGMLCL